MILQDLHVHTTYCDGKNTPEELVLAALNHGMKCIGFSGHSYTFFDESYCMSKQNTARYRAEIAGLKEKYNGKIKVLCGVEQDYYSEEPTVGYDYVIGSVHYIKADGEYIPVDESAEILKSAVQKHFNGDFYAFAEEYYRTVAALVKKTSIDIIGHFDLITKFNERYSFFDEKDPRYINAWHTAADKLIVTDKPFEINTGAISRGYKQSPYPSADIINYIKQKGGGLILNSDSHTAENLCFGFEEYSKFLND